MIKNSSEKSYLFILPWSLTSLGGVNQVVENLYCQMKLDGKYDPLIMVNSWDDIEIKKQNINEIDHYFFRLRSPWNSLRKIFNFLAFCLELFRTTWLLHKFIRLNRISVINFHYCSLFALNICFMKFIRLFKGRLVLSFHGQDLLFAKESQGIEAILWKILLRSADTIITCSESLMKELVQFDQSVFSKVVSIHNGVDASLSYEGEERPIGSSLEKKQFILNVATLERKKGQDVLLKAFKKISQDFVDVDLVIIGRPAGMENEIKKMIVSLGLSHRVLLYDGLSHDQVLAFMESAIIFVLPSRYEPFGIVILEAGGFGTPVIASNVGGIREILSHNKTGRLCDPEDINALAKELTKLLQNPEERKRLGDNLKKHILQNFSWERTYQKYLYAIGL